MFAVYHEPKVIKNFITDEMCDFLINTDVSPFKKSRIGYGKIFSKDRRVSKTKWIPRTYYKVKEIYEKCSQLTNIPITNIENVSVIKYEEGGYYKEHIDVDVGFNEPRLYTIILYLNDNYEGGETEFTLLNKKYKLKKGDALFFNNYDSLGNVSRLALHRGNEVISGVKYIANVWIQNKPIYYSNLPHD
jgi:prolyl 4-hydroxylase